MSHILFVPADEVLVGVFGRAGMQSYYKREMINSIGFVVLDPEKQSVRVVPVSLILAFKPSKY